MKPTKKQRDFSFTANKNKRGAGQQPVEAGTANGRDDRHLTAVGRVEKRREELALMRELYG